MTDDNRVGKIKKLLELAMEYQEKLADIHLEINELIGGGAGIGAKLKQVETAWMAAWSSRYHEEYVFAYVKDRPQIKRLLKSLTAEQLQVRMLNYIKSDDPFYVQRRHSFGLFCSSVNNHAPASEAPAFALADNARPFACMHRPACRSDQEHTTRRARDMRSAGLDE